MEFGEEAIREKEEIVQLVRCVESGEGRDQLTRRLRDVYVGYVRCEGDQENKKEEVGGKLLAKDEALVRRRMFLKSYLPPMGVFLDAVLSVAYEMDSDDGGELGGIADRFFLDVHPIFAVGALVAYVSRSGEVTRGVGQPWRLLKDVVLRDVDKFVDAVCDGDVWGDVFPERTWSDCGDLIVGWLVSMSEAAQSQKSDNGEFEPGRFLPVMVRALSNGSLSSLDERRSETKLTLLGTFLARFLNRGFGPVVVEALVDACLPYLENREPIARLSQIIPSIRDAHAKEKFFKHLLSTLARSFADAHVPPLLRAFAQNPSGTEMSDEVSYILFDRILLKDPLPKQTAEWLLSLLIEDEGKLMDAACQLARTWSGKDAIHHLPLPRQAYFTFLLTVLIPHLPGAFVEVGDATINRFLLEGVSNRLENCIETIRFQGMRVAHAMAARQPDSGSLFSDLTDFQTLQEEEIWDPSLDTHDPGKAAASRELTEPDSDDESDFGSDLVNLDDLEPSVENVDGILMKDHRPVTLMDLHQDLKKTDEPLKLIKALKQLTVLLKAHPSELPSIAAELSRTLIHVPLPDWIHEELKKDDAFELKGLKSSSAVRVCCLVCLLTEASVCGDSVAKMIASKQVAEHQRLEILEAMQQAALQLSKPPAHGPDSHKEDLNQKRRVWGVRSLTLSKQTSTATWRNPFVDVAGLWASELLLSCQTVTHGFNIMERNHMVLGGVLVTLGTFADCASQSMVSTSLALTSFPFIKAVMEQKGEVCHLRRCAFQALTSIIQALPIGRLSSALSSSALTPVMDETDRSLGEMLVWIKAQSEHGVTSDSDETCRLLAVRCLHVCADISKKALDFSQHKAPDLKPMTIEYRIPQTQDHLRFHSGPFE